MFNVTTLNHFLLVAFLSYNAPCFNKQYNRISHNKLYYSEQKTFTYYYKLFPLHEK